MSIEVACEGCRKRYKVPESASGKKLRCKACGAAIVVPAVESDPFENPDALMAMEESATPQPAPYLPPMPKPRTAISSKTILLISAAAGGVLAFVGLVFLIIHFTSSQPKTQSPHSAGQNASADAPQGATGRTSIEQRLGEIWELYSQYAAAHDGHYPATLEDVDHAELVSGIDGKRSLAYTLGITNLQDCKAPLPAKLIIASGGLGPSKTPAEYQTIALFGDGHIQQLDQKNFQTAQQESSEVEGDARLWLASDRSTPKGGLISWLIALGMGNADALKARSYNIDAGILDAMAAQRAASREFVAAAATRFPGANGAEPRPPKTETDIAREGIKAIRNVSVEIAGETAKIGQAQPLELKNSGAGWQLNVDLFFKHPTPAQTHLGILFLQINARATREIAQETSAGKYSDWSSAKQAVLDRIKMLAKGDAEFQQAAAARTTPFPSFSLMDPWSIQQGYIEQPGAASDASLQPAPVNPPHDATSAVVPPATTALVTPILPDPNDKPEPLRTELAGGKGGGPFEKLSPGSTPIVGFRYALGRWKTQGVVQQFEPIFQGADDKPSPENMKKIVARNGYVVGGLLVDFDDINVIALRVIFVRRKDDQIDAADQYRSEWIGTPAGKHQRQIAGKGETIIGTFGRQGLNLGAIGLLKPSNLRKTAMVGGNGGGPFSSAGDGEKLVRGFRYSPGNWNGPVIGHFYPLYDPAGNDPPAAGQDLKSAKNILARDGYAVGGLIADFDDVNFFAFRVIFLREKDGHLDAKDQYTSDWVGTPAGKHQQQLAGNGEVIVGIFGRQGLNCDAIGLLERLSKASAATKAVLPK